MKTCLAFLITAVLSLAFLQNPLQAQSVLIDLLGARGNPGSAVQVSVVLESTGDVHPAGLQVDLSFDPAVLNYVRVAKGQASNDAGKNVAANLIGSGSLRLLVAGLNQTNISDGTLAQVEFQIAGNAAVSSSPITVKNAIASTQSGQSIPVLSGSGLVVIRGGIINPSYLYFAQLADGSGYASYFVLVNPGNSSVSALLELYQQDGTPLVLKLNGNLDTVFAVTLPAHSATLLESANTGQVRAGWARVLSSAPVGGSIVYSFSTTAGTEISEAGIDPSIPSNSFALSVDTRRGFFSGLALANPNASQVSLELTLYNRSGTQVGRQTRTLPAMNQFALMLEQLFPGTAGGNFTGVVTVSASGGQVVGTTLRFNADSSVFSSIPVITARAGPDANELYFPQIADGGGYSTMFVLINDGATAVTGSLDLFQASGAPLALNLNGTIASTFNLNIPAKGMALYESPNSGATQAGWARVRASGPIGGSIIYGYSSPPGNLISEAGINPAQPVNSFALSVDIRHSYQAGLAVVNPGTAAVSLTLILYDNAGNQISRVTRTLESQRYFAEMVDQIFPGITLINFPGVITVTATGGRIAGTTLRFNADLSVFASIPVL